jgi:hypothetical protein
VYGKKSNQPAANITTAAGMLFFLAQKSYLTTSLLVEQRTIVSSLFTWIVMNPALILMK